MNDKGLQLFLTVTFGIGGIAILVLAWPFAYPVTLQGRILTTLIGSVGLVWALIKTLSLMPMLHRGQTNQR